MQLLTGIEYFGKSKVAGHKQEVLCQTILSGGTATFFIKNKDAPSFSAVKALTDVPETLRVPIEGSYKVELTGSAVVYGDWS